MSMRFDFSCGSAEGYCMDCSGCKDRSAPMDIAWNAGLSQELASVFAGFVMNNTDERQTREQAIERVAFVSAWFLRDFEGGPEIAMEWAKRR